MDIAGVKCVMVEKTLYITIDGDIDHHTAKFIREEIDKAIYYYRPGVAIMDLNQVSFMDSSGLGLILGRYTNMTMLQSTLKLIEPPAFIMKILYLAGVDRLIPIVKPTDVENAVF